jgi:hypothetical protein
MRHEGDSRQESFTEDRTVDCTLLLLLIVSLVLVTVDILEIYKLIQSWPMLKLSPVFDSCIKYELISRTVFASYSFLAASSAFMLAIGLLSGVNTFIDKYIDTFLYYNYLIFGPYMLTLSVLAIVYWNNTLFVCDKVNVEIKHFSFTNVFAVLLCLVISLFITISKAVYQVILLLQDSILKRGEGSAMLRKLFWFVALRNRAEHSITNNVNISNNII